MSSTCDKLNKAYLYSIPLLAIYNIVTDILYISAHSIPLAESQFLGLYWIAFTLVPGLLLIASIIQFIKECECSSVMSLVSVLMIFIVWLRIAACLRKLSELEGKK